MCPGWPLGEKIYPVSYWMLLVKWCLFIAFFKFSCNSTVSWSVLWVVHKYFIVMNHMAFYAADKLNLTYWQWLIFSSLLVKACQIGFHLLYLLVECWATEAQPESYGIRETWSSSSIFEIRRISRPNSNERGENLWCYYSHHQKGRSQVAYIREEQKAFLS